jgi:hypothetical protein
LRESPKTPLLPREVEVEARADAALIKGLMRRTHHGGPPWTWRSGRGFPHTTSAVQMLNVSGLRGWIRTIFTTLRVSVHRA